MYDILLQFLTMRKEFMKTDEVIEAVFTQTRQKLSYSDLAKILKIGRQTVSYYKTNDKELPQDYIEKIENHCKINLSLPVEAQSDCVNVLYRPNVYLSAGYGIEVYNEQAETICLDRKLFITDRGIRINPNNCEVVTVSGNSMSPEYKHGDRVILDKSVTSFADGHIFAFRYCGECFMKEICIIGKRIKCIPINKEYEPFFIEPDEEVTILGRILPRIRL